MYIEPLSHNTLDDAIDLGDRVFPNKELEDPADEFLMSLGLNEDDAYMEKTGIIDLDYWVTKEGRSNQVVGTVGLYQTIKDYMSFDPKPDPDKELVWLAYWMVDKPFRERRIGTRLLEYAIEKAREDYDILRVWTLRNSNEADAQRIYDKKGIKIIKEMDPPHGFGNDKLIIRELNL